MWKAGDGILHGDWDQVVEAGKEDLDATGQAWLGLTHLVSSIAIPVNPALRMQLLQSGAFDWLPSDVRKGAEDWTAADGTALYGTVAGFVGLTLPQKWWDPKAYKADQVFKNWTENPGGAAGTSVANIASFFIPGAGEAKAAGIAGDAAKVAEGTRVADMLADGSIGTLRGLSADALKATIKGLSDADAAKLAAELAKPELDAGALSGLKLDDLTIHEPPAPHDVPAGPAAERAPDRTPLVDEAPATHDTPPVRDAPPAHEAPVAHDAPPAHEAPVAHEPPAAEGAPSSADAPSSGSDPAHDGPHDASTTEQSPHREDDTGLYNRLQPDDKGTRMHWDLVDPEVPVGEGGPGWVRLPDLPAPTDGVPHGEVLPEHGSYAERTDPMNQKSASLRVDPDAPWGRFSDGRPLTQDDWVERYQKPDGFAYPDNGGAVSGTRAEVTDLGVILREFGPQVDRIGYPGGGYLSPIIDSAPFSFESRALVPDTLYKPYTSYIIGADQLPEGWSVVVSRVAPAEGFPGGAVQLQFFDHGQEVNVTGLFEAHVLLE